jgi:hypothetical protein
MNQDRKMELMMKAINIIACTVLAIAIIFMLLILFVFVAGITMTIQWILG